MGSMPYKSQVTWTFLTKDNQCPEILRLFSFRYLTWKIEQTKIDFEHLKMIIGEYVYIMVCVKRSEDSSV